MCIIIAFSRIWVSQWLKPQLPRKIFLHTSILYARLNLKNYIRHQYPNHPRIVLFFQPHIIISHSHSTHIPQPPAQTLPFTQLAAFLLILSARDLTARSKVKVYLSLSFALRNPRTHTYTYPRYVSSNSRARALSTRSVQRASHAKALCVYNVCDPDERARASVYIRAKANAHWIIDCLARERASEAI